MRKSSSDIGMKVGEPRLKSYHEFRGRPFHRKGLSMTISVGKITESSMIDRYV